jgi:DNA repair protein RadC
MKRKRVKRNDLMVDVRRPIVERIKEHLRGLGLTKAEVNRLLEAYPEGQGLDNAYESYLEEILGPTKARRVIAAFGVTRACDEACQATAERFGSVNTPDAVVRLLRDAIGRKEQEYMVAILLDSRQRPIDLVGASVGSLSHVDVHPRELFREAVRRGTHSVIIAHNHPSGSARPSNADLEFTQRMIDAGKLMGIPVLDSIVVSRGDSTSMRAGGLMTF